MFLQVCPPIIYTKDDNLTGFFVRNCSSSRQFNFCHLCKTQYDNLPLQALNGFLMILDCQGELFFATHSIETYLGFHQVSKHHHPKNSRSVFLSSPAPDWTLTQPEQGSELWNHYCSDQLFTFLPWVFIWNKPQPWTRRCGQIPWVWEDQYSLSEAEGWEQFIFTAGIVRASVFQCIPVEHSSSYLQAGLSAPVYSLTA